jgi:hypothetical protein
VRFRAGRHCAKIDVTVKQPKGKGSDGKGGEDSKNKQPDSEADKDSNGKKEKDVRLPERLCIDPQHLALFAPPAESGESGESEAERGLALRYVQLSTECWDAEAVRKQMDTLRAKDDEADLHQEVRTPSHGTG